MRVNICKAKWYIPNVNKINVWYIPNANKINETKSSGEYKEI